MKQIYSLLLGMTLLPLTLPAQVATTDTEWCAVMEQALADQGVSANVRSDISGNNKTVHVTVGNTTKQYFLPSDIDRQDYSSPVYVMIDAFDYRMPPLGYDRHGRNWMGSRSITYMPDEVFSHPADAEALQADIRTAVGSVERITLVDGEFTSTALASDIPLLVMKGNIIAVQRGERFKKEAADRRGPRVVEREFAYANIHVELTNYRTGEIIWSTNLSKDDYSASQYTDPMNSVRQDICTSIRRKLAALYPNTAPRMSVNGRILSVAEQKKDKAERVYIDLGFDNEVREGDTFTVYAPLSVGTNQGATPIGTLSVAEVQGGTLSLCKVKKGNKEILSAIQNGASLMVSSKW